MVTDIIVLAVLLLSALISFVRGFIREVLTILGVVGGLAAAYAGGPMLSPQMKDWLGVVEGEKPERFLGVLPYPILADILSYGLIFIVVVIVLSVISHILAETTKALGLGAIDRTLGFVFGLLRGILLIAVLYLPFYLSLDKETKVEWFEGSKSYVYLEAMGAELAKYLPADTTQKIEEAVQQGAEKAGQAGVREKLQQIDLLPTDGDPARDEGQSTPPETSPGAEHGEGYTDEFRAKMDKMFDQGTTPPQPEQPAIPKGPE